MKNNKKYKLNLIILLCLTIILILIYLKDKQIDLFYIFKLPNSKTDNKYYDCKMSNTNNKINNLQKNIKRVLNGDNIIENTNITKHCKITTATPTAIPTATPTAIPTAIPTATPTATPTTTKFRPPSLNPADQEDVTGLLKPTEQEEQEENQFVVPFPQPAFIALTDFEADEICNSGFNDSQNISNDCKTFISGDRQEVNWNNFFQECVQKVKSIGKNRQDNDYNEKINDFIQKIDILCVDNNIS